jgi:oligoendopeptidase F
MFRRNFFVEPALDPPTWTHDIFHITHPCYIQNYVLAEIMAFHLLSGSRKKGSETWTPGFTGKIVDVLLVPGAMKTWREKVTGFSGSAMGPEALIREVFKPRAS